MKARLLLRWAIQGFWMTSNLTWTDERGPGHQVFAKIFRKVRWLRRCRPLYVIQDQPKSPEITALPFIGPVLPLLWFALPIIVYE